MSVKFKTRHEIIVQSRFDCPAFITYSPSEAQYSSSDKHAASLFYSPQVLQKRYSEQKSEGFDHIAGTNSTVSEPLSDGRAGIHDSRSEAATYIATACLPLSALESQSSRDTARGKYPSIQQADKRPTPAGPCIRQGKRQ